MDPMGGEWLFFSDGFHWFPSPQKKLFHFTHPTDPPYQGITRWRFRDAVFFSKHSLDTVDLGPMKMANCCWKNSTNHWYEGARSWIFGYIFSCMYILRSHNRSFGYLDSYCLDPPPRMQSSPPGLWNILSRESLYYESFFFFARIAPSSLSRQRMSDMIERTKRWQDAMFSYDGCK